MPTLTMISLKCPKCGGTVRQMCYEIDGERYVRNPELVRCCHCGEMYDAVAGDGPVGLRELTHDV